MLERERILIPSRQTYQNSPFDMVSLTTVALYPLSECAFHQHLPGNDYLDGTSDSMDRYHPVSQDTPHHYEPSISYVRDRERCLTPAFSSVTQTFVPKSSCSLSDSIYHPLAVTIEMIYKHTPLSSNSIQKPSLILYIVVQKFF